MPDGSSGFGKWLSGVAATVIGAVLIWALTRPDGILNPPTPTPPPPTPIPTAPHAPPLTVDQATLYNEQLKLIELQAGEQKWITAEELWFEPVGFNYSCWGFVRMSWVVRDPYPVGPEDFQIQTYVSTGGGLRDVVASGSEGHLDAELSDGFFFVNNGLQVFYVEIRYATALYRC